MPGKMLSVPATTAPSQSVLTESRTPAHVSQSQPNILPPAQEPVQGAPSRFVKTSDTKTENQSLPTQPVKKKVIRPLKFHETKLFLKKESTVRSELDLPSHLGYRAGECYRLAATIDRLIEKSALRVRPVSWGYGTQNGTLGHGNTERIVDALKRVAAFRREYLSQVSAGDKLSLFLTNAGRVLQCGRLYLHQDGVRMWTPREVMFTMEVAGDPGKSVDNPQQVKIVQVQAGHLAAYAVDFQGRVYAWGAHRYGQLGLGEEQLDNNVGNSDVVTDSDNQTNSENDDEGGSDVQTNSSLRRHDPVEWAPRLVQSSCLDGVRITKLSAGNHFVLAMSSTGRVYSWGWNWHGQLGQGDDAVRRSVPSPQRVTSALESLIAIDVSAGHSHSLVVAMPRGDQASQGAPLASYTIVLSFGLGKKGRLGIGGQVDRTEPTEVTFFRGLHPTHVAAGHDHSLVLCAVGSRNYVYAFGGNEFGQLGISQTAITWSDMPLSIDELSGLAMATVGAGAYVSSALSGDGEVYTWGDGSHGKTARPDKRTTFMPWKVPAEAGSSNEDTSHASKSVNHRVLLGDDGFVVQLSMGAYHSIALYRVDGRPDRWRKFPIGEIAVSLDINDSYGNKSVALVCASSHIQISIAPFGILLYCETCLLGPVCRVCSRRCHRGHKLVPRHHFLKECKFTATGVSMSCACGNRRPPPPPFRQPPSAHRKPAFKLGILQASPEVPVEDSPTKGQSPSDHGDSLPVYCSLVSMPVPIPEDSLLR